MCQVNMYQAKTEFSKLVAMLERGEEDEVLICRDGVPVAKMVFYSQEDNVSKRIGLHKNNPIWTEDFEEAFYDADKDVKEMFGL